MKTNRLLKQTYKNIGKTMEEILQSKTRASIYIYLLLKNSATSDEIIENTHLYPSTVREALSKMHEQKIIKREKIKNESVGKNPYLYHAMPLNELLKRYVSEIENNLNKIAELDHFLGHGKQFRINIKLTEGRR